LGSSCNSTCSFGVIRAVKGNWFVKDSATELTVAAAPCRAPNLADDAALRMKAQHRMRLPKPSADDPEGLSVRPYHWADTMNGAL
jgi:hypothetical protein